MMCILVAALNDDVHSCIGVGRLCAFLCLSWLTMCIPASALNDYVHSCIGVGRLCAFLFLLWMTICILVSALNDDVHSCNYWFLAKSESGWPGRLRL